MAKPRMPPVSLGTLLENRVFELLTALSNGDLVCYKPISDHEGTDLIVKRRFREAVLKIQIKGRTSHRAGGAIELGVAAVELPESDPKYVVVLDYHSGRAALGRFLWVIPAADFKRLASTSVGFYKSLLSPAPTARDRWVDYRYNPNDLAWVVTAILDAEERGEATGTREGVIAALEAARPRPQGRRPTS